MNGNTSPITENPNLTRAILRRMAQILGYMLAIGAILFVTAWRLDWFWAWVYIGESLVQLAVNAFVLLRHHPDLAAERAEIKEDTKGWDKTITALMIIPGFGIYIVAGLDYRFEWSPQIALAIHIAALIVMVLGQIWLLWAMDTNRFFASSVRIQTERGHTVVSGGPYRYVRHPGYIGMVVGQLAMCLLLGSLWALIMAGMSAALYVIRTALEDKTLQAELPGYAEYAQQTRYRLLPGIW